MRASGFLALFLRPKEENFLSAWLLGLALLTDPTAGSPDQRKLKTQGSPCVRKAQGFTWRKKAPRKLGEGPQGSRGVPKKWYGLELDGEDREKNDLRNFGEKGE